jgi:hypothetical protein
MIGGLKSWGRYLVLNGTEHDLLISRDQIWMNVVSLTDERLQIYFLFQKTVRYSQRFQTSRRGVSPIRFPTPRNQPHPSPRPRLESHLLPSFPKRFSLPSPPYAASKAYLFPPNPLRYVYHHDPQRRDRHKRQLAEIVAYLPLEAARTAARSQGRDKSTEGFEVGGDWIGWVRTGKVE